MDVETRLRAVEERLAEVETAQRNEGASMRAIFELVQRIDGNMSSVAARAQALETNFSLLNAKVDTLDRKVTDMDRKVDQILDLMRHQTGSSNRIAVPLISAGSLPRAGLCAVVVI